MTELLPLKGMAPKWQLVHFGRKIGYFGHMFLDMDFKFVLPIIYVHWYWYTNQIRSQLDLNWPYELQKNL